MSIIHFTLPGPELVDQFVLCTHCSGLHHAIARSKKHRQLCVLELSTTCLVLDYRQHVVQSH